MALFLLMRAALLVTCTSADNPGLVNPCLDKSGPYAKMPWCNATLSVGARVQDMLQRMTLKEKISNLGTSAGPTASLGLPAYDWWSEGTHGISRVQNRAPTPFETNFAFPITTAMSFNRSLWRTTAAQIATEARAFMNAGNAYSTYWAPVINLAREPRWGRNIETPGEDPYLTSEYAVAWVHGFQLSAADPSHMLASACCKHYAANSMEDSSEAGYHSDRYHFDANVTMQDLVDSYLLPFQACVEKGQVSGLMCSYNAINGVPSCANDWLLTTVARESWGFDGYITSDCDADADVYNSHHYTKTPEETVQAVLRAGTDVDCTSFVVQHAQKALDQGLITEADIDARLANLFKVRMRLAHFDPVGPLGTIPPSAVCTQQAKDLARDGVAQGATLLKNEGATLPLKAESLETVAVIGPNSNLSRSMAGYYGGGSCDNKFWTMFDAIQQYVPKASTMLGVPNVTSDDTSQIPAAAQMAAVVDKVVLVLGTDLTTAMEARDASTLKLSAGQQKLLLDVANSSKTPVVVVMLTATPLDISEILAHPKVGAVLHLGQPSVQTLGAGDIIFGKKVPAGRTIQTIYPASFADSISIFDFNMRPGPSNWPRPDCPKEQWGHCPMGTNPGRTHRFYTGTPVIPFGFGLSYTSFKYSIVSSSTRVMLGRFAQRLKALRDSAKHLSLVEIEKIGPPASFRVDVTNTGNTDADDAVLGFLTPPGAGQNGIPRQTLFGFDRVHVRAGETVTVWLYPTFADFTNVDTSGNRHVLTGEYGVHFGVRETALFSMGFAKTRLQAVLDGETNDLFI